MSWTLVKSQTSRTTTRTMKEWLLACLYKEEKVPITNDLPAQKLKSFDDIINAIHVLLHCTPPPPFHFFFIIISLFVSVQILNETEGET